MLGGLDLDNTHDLKVFFCALVDLVNEPDAPEKMSANRLFKTLKVKHARNGHSREIARMYSTLRSLRGMEGV